MRGILIIKQLANNIDIIKSQILKPFLARCFLNLAITP